MQTDLPLQIQVETSNALQQHFPGLLESGLRPWASTLQQYRNEVMATQAISAKVARQQMDDSKAAIISTVQTHNQAGIDAVRGLQATMKAISSRIENTVSAQKIDNSYRHEQFMSALSSYRSELGSLNRTISQTQVSKLSRAMSYHELDMEPSPQLRQLGEQLSLWYFPRPYPLL